RFGFPFARPTSRGNPRGGCRTIDADVIDCQFSLRGGHRPSRFPPRSRRAVSPPPHDVVGREGAALAAAHLLSRHRWFNQSMRAVAVVIIPDAVHRAARSEQEGPPRWILCSPPSV